MLDRRNFILGGLAVSACSTMPQSNNISDDEYEIFNVIWKDLPCRAKDELDLIESITFPVKRSDRLWKVEPSMTQWMRPDRGKIISIPEEAIENFFSVNENSFPIEAQRINNKCVTLVSKERIEEVSPTLDAGAYYDRLRDERVKVIGEYIEAQRKGNASEIPPPKFEKELPARTVHSISRFGFNSDRTLAVGARTYFCGPLCAGWLCVVATKQNTGWRIDDEIYLMIS
ncbi:hypothetical protein [Hyphococcus sp.]|uniref:hypothetical protein n=1 Tax=Hyphococcus sp. TaxID=2038636 RepID=UPI0035C75D3F